MFLLLIALLIVIFFRLTRYLLPYMRLSQSSTYIIGRYLPAAELLVWVVFLTWSVEYLYYRAYLLTLIPLLVFVIITLYLAWFSLKDLVAGIIFRSTSTLQPNDQISVAGISGRITAMHRCVLEVEDHAGRIAAIPYSRITSQILLRHFPSQSLLSHNFQLQVPKTDSNVFTLTHNLRLTILTLPWASQKKEPTITIESETSSHVIYNITIFSLDEKYFPLTEKFLKEQFKTEN